MKLDGMIPPNIAERMAPEDRKQYGRRATTPAEDQTTYEQKTESKEQGHFAGLLKLARNRGELTYDWSRTDKRTRNRTGRADFWIMARGRGLQIEFKVPGGRLSPAQKDERDKAEASGTVYKIVGSADEAWHLTREWLEQ